MSKATLLKKTEVLGRVSVSTATWYRMIKENPILKPIKMGRGSFWKESVIETFINELDSEKS